LRLSGKRDREPGPQKIHPQKSENWGTKSETKIEIEPVEWRLNAGSTACREGLLDWCNFPHDYFYGN
jgi:hypothetical protein